MHIPNLHFPVYSTTMRGVNIAIHHISSTPQVRKGSFTFKLAPVTP